MVFGRRIAAQGNNPHEIVRRLARRLMLLAGSDTMEDTVAMIHGVSGRGGRTLSHNAEKSIKAVHRVLRLD